MLHPLKFSAFFPFTQIILLTHFCHIQFSYKWPKKKLKVQHRTITNGKKPAALTISLMSILGCSYAQRKKKERKKDKRKKERKTDNGSIHTFKSLGPHVCDPGDLAVWFFSDFSNFIMKGLVNRLYHIVWRSGGRAELGNWIYRDNSILLVQSHRLYNNLKSNLFHRIHWYNQ